MKTSLTRLSVAAVAAALSAATLTTGTASAVPDPVLRVELGPNTTLAGVVAVDAKYNLGESRSVGIPALQQLRREMWDINPPFEGRPLRDQAIRAGLTTKEAYATAPRSDLHLTYSAAQRAMETQPGRKAHMRPSGACPTPTPEGCEAWSATHSGVRLDGPEILAPAPLARSIGELWGHGELRALREAEGTTRGGHDGYPSGHLWTLINPAYTSYGFAYVQTKEGSRITGNSAGLASTRQANTTALPDEPRHTWLYRAPWPGENPTGLVAEPPAEWSAFPGLGGSGDLDAGSLTDSLDGAGDAGSVQAALPLLVTGAVIAANIALQGGIRF